MRAFFQWILLIWAISLSQSTILKDATLNNIALQTARKSNVFNSNVTEFIPNDIIFFEGKPKKSLEVIRQLVKTPLSDNIKVHSSKGVSRLTDFILSKPTKSFRLVKDNQVLNLFDLASLLNVKEVSFIRPSYMIIDGEQMTMSEIIDIYAKDINNRFFVKYSNNNEYIFYDNDRVSTTQLYNILFHRSNYVYDFSQLEVNGMKYPLKVIIYVLAHVPNLKVIYQNHKLTVLDFIRWNPNFRGMFQLEYENVIDNLVDVFRKALQYTIADYVMLPKTMILPYYALKSLENVPGLKAWRPGYKSKIKSLKLFLDDVYPDEDPKQNLIQVFQNGTLLTVQNIADLLLSDGYIIFGDMSYVKKLPKFENYLITSGGFNYTINSFLDTYGRTSTYYFISYNGRILTMKELENLMATLPEETKLTTPEHSVVSMAGVAFRYSELAYNLALQKPRHVMIFYNDTSYTPEQFINLYREGIPNNFTLEKNGVYIPISDIFKLLDINLTPQFLKTYKIMNVIYNGQMYTKDDVLIAILENPDKFAILDSGQFRSPISFKELYGDNVPEFVVYYDGKPVKPEDINTVLNLETILEDEFYPILYNGKTYTPFDVVTMLYNQQPDNSKILHKERIYTPEEYKQTFPSTKFQVLYNDYPIKAEDLEEILDFDLKHSIPKSQLRFFNIKYKGTTYTKEDIIDSLIVQEPPNVKILHDGIFYLPKQFKRFTAGNIPDNFAVVQNRRIIPSKLLPTIVRLGDSKQTNPKIFPNIIYAGKEYTPDDILQLIITQNPPDVAISIRNKKFSPKEFEKMYDGVYPITFSILFKNIEITPDELVNIVDFENLDSTEVPKIVIYTTQKDDQWMPTTTTTENSASSDNSVRDSIETQTEDTKQRFEEDDITTLSKSTKAQVYISTENATESIRNVFMSSELESGEQHKEPLPIGGQKPEDNNYQVIDIGPLDTFAKQSQFPYIVHDGTLYSPGDVIRSIAEMLTKETLTSKWTIHYNGVEYAPKGFLKTFKVLPREFKIFRNNEQIQPERLSTFIKLRNYGFMVQEKASNGKVFPHLVINGVIYSPKQILDCLINQNPDNTYILHQGRIYQPSKFQEQYSGKPIPDFDVVVRNETIPKDMLDKVVNLENENFFTTTQALPVTTPLVPTRVISDANDDNNGNAEGTDHTDRITFKTTVPYLPTTAPVITDSKDDTRDIQNKLDKKDQHQYLTTPAPVFKTTTTIEPVVQFPYIVYNGSILSPYEVAKTLKEQKPENIIIVADNEKYTTDAFYDRYIKDAPENFEIYQSGKYVEPADIPKIVNFDANNYIGYDYNDEITQETKTKTPHVPSKKPNIPDFVKEILKQNPNTRVVVEGQEYDMDEIEGWNNIKPDTDVPETTILPNTETIKSAQSTVSPNKQYFEDLQKLSTYPEGKDFVIISDKNAYSLDTFTKTFPDKIPENIKVIQNKTEIPKKVVEDIVKNIEDKIYRSMISGEGYDYNGKAKITTTTESTRITSPLKIKSDSINDPKDTTVIPSIPELNFVTLPSKLTKPESIKNIENNIVVPDIVEANSDIFPSKPTTIMNELPSTVATTSYFKDKTLEDDDYQQTTTTTKIVTTEPSTLMSNHEPITTALLPEDKDGNEAESGIAHGIVNPSTGPTVVPYEPNLFKNPTNLPTLPTIFIPTTVSTNPKYSSSTDKLEQQPFDLELLTPTFIDTEFNLKPTISTFITPLPPIESIDELHPDKAEKSVTPDNEVSLETTESSKLQKPKIQNNSDIIKCLATDNPLNVRVVYDGISYNPVELDEAVPDLPPDVDVKFTIDGKSVLPSHVAEFIRPHPKQDLKNQPSDDLTNLEIVNYLTTDNPADVNVIYQHNSYTPQEFLNAHSNLPPNPDIKFTIDGEYAKPSFVASLIKPKLKSTPSEETTWYPVTDHPNVLIPKYSTNIPKPVDDVFQTDTPHEYVQFGSVTQPTIAPGDMKDDSKRNSTQPISSTNLLTVPTKPTRPTSLTFKTNTDKIDEFSGLPHDMVTKFSEITKPTTSNIPRINYPSVPNQTDEYIPFSTMPHLPSIPSLPQVKEIPEIGQIFKDIKTTAPTLFTSHTFSSPEGLEKSEDFKTTSTIGNIVMPSTPTKLVLATHIPKSEVPVSSEIYEGPILNNPLTSKNNNFSLPTISTMPSFSEEQYSSNIPQSEVQVSSEAYEGPTFNIWSTPNINKFSVPTKPTKPSFSDKLYSSQSSMILGGYLPTIPSTHHAEITNVSTEPIVLSNPNIVYDLGTGNPFNLKVKIGNKVTNPPESTLPGKTQTPTKLSTADFKIPDIPTTPTKLLIGNNPNLQFDVYTSRIPQVSTKMPFLKENDKELPNTPFSPDTVTPNMSTKPSNPLLPKETPYTEIPKIPGQTDQELFNKSTPLHIEIIPTIPTWPIYSRKPGFPEGTMENPRKSTPQPNISNIPTKPTTSPFLKEPTLHETFNSRLPNKPMRLPGQSNQDIITEPIPPYFGTKNIPTKPTWPPFSGKLGFPEKIIENPRKSTPQPNISNMPTKPTSPFLEGPSLQETFNSRIPNKPMRLPGQSDQDIITEPIPPYFEIKNIPTKPTWPPFSGKLGFPEITMENPRKSTPQPNILNMPTKSTTAPFLERPSLQEIFNSRLPNKPVRLPGQSDQDIITKPIPTYFKTENIPTKPTWPPFLGKPGFPKNTMENPRKSTPQPNISNMPIKPTTSPFLEGPTSQEIFNTRLPNKPMRLPGQNDQDIITEPIPPYFEIKHIPTVPTWLPSSGKPGIPEITIKNLLKSTPQPNISYIPTKPTTLPFLEKLTSRETFGSKLPNTPIKLPGETYQQLDSKPTPSHVETINRPTKPIWPSFSNKPGVSVGINVDKTIAPTASVESQTGLNEIDKSLQTPVENFSDNCNASGCSTSSNTEYGSISQNSNEKLSSEMVGDKRTTDFVQIPKLPNLPNIPEFSDLSLVTATTDGTANTVFGENSKETRPLSMEPLPYLRNETLFIKENSVFDELDLVKKLTVDNPKNVSLICGERICSPREFMKNLPSALSPKRITFSVNDQIVSAEYVASLLPQTAENNLNRDIFPDVIKNGVTYTPRDVIQELAKELNGECVMVMYNGKLFTPLQFYSLYGQREPFPNNFQMQLSGQIVDPKTFMSVFKDFNQLPGNVMQTENITSKELLITKKDRVGNESNDSEKSQNQKSTELNIVASFIEKVIAKEPNFNILYQNNVYSPRQYLKTFGDNAPKKFQILYHGVKMSPRSFYKKLKGNYLNSIGNIGRSKEPEFPTISFEGEEFSPQLVLQKLAVFNPNNVAVRYKGVRYTPMQAIASFNTTPTNFQLIDSADNIMNPLEPWKYLKQDYEKGRKALPLENKRFPVIISNGKKFSPEEILRNIAESNLNVNVKLPNGSVTTPQQILQTSPIPTEFELISNGVKIKPNDIARIITL